MLFLGDQDGFLLYSGQLLLRFEPETGAFAVWAYDTHKLPICPLHYHRVLRNEHPEFRNRLGDEFSGLPDWRPRIAQRAKDLQAESAPRAASAVTCGKKACRPRSGG